MFFVLLTSLFGILPGAYAAGSFADIYIIYPKNVKTFYPKNNNRIDRPKHAQINQPIHQPRKHNHEPRCNSRRNQ